MAAKFAEGTTVSVEQTRVEIERTLARFNADAFMSGYEGLTAFIIFRLEGRHIRLTLTLPSRDDPAFRVTDSGRARKSDATVEEAYDKECRRRWRSLALLVKAKVAAVADGIVTFEEEFFSHIVLPDGATVYQHAKGPLAIAYASGEMPQLIPGPKK